MAKQTNNYITEDKKKELETELAELQGPRRKEILESLAYAKSLGDLSENAEYHQAREDQGKLEERIARVEEILRLSQIVPTGSQSGGKKRGGRVDIGSKVVVQKEGEREEKIYQIVGGEEADMAQGKISNRSPFGQAFLGKKKGDDVFLKTPGGAVQYKVIKVYY